MSDPKPGDKDHAWIDWEAKSVEVDGSIFPITKMWGLKGDLTEVPEEAVIIQAGKNDKWISLRLLK